MRHQPKLWLAAASAALALALASCSTPAPEEPTTPPAAGGDQGDIAELVEAAKAEGKLVWYTGQTQSIAESAIAGFKAEYGIDVEFVSLNAGTLSQRYQTEAEAGTITADVISQSANPAFVEFAVDKGWGMRIEDAGLPVFDLGTYPTEYFQEDGSATVGFLPYLILYNTDLIDGDMIPSDLGDLADPKYKDKLLLADPTTADNLVQFYDAIEQEYGKEWFEDVLANNPKFYPTISNAVQAMTAGEGAITTPAAGAVAAPLIAQGAPVGMVTPPVTTGPEVQVMLTDSAKAPHPNAAKLFVNWLLSESGNRTAWGDLGVSVYNPDEVPSGYSPGRVVTPEIKNGVLRLLGLPTT